MKPFLTASARGASIFAFYFCLSLVVGVLGFIGEFLPPVASIPLLIVFGPAVIYRSSRWLAPDLFGEPRSWWRRRAESKQR
jgi:uncharacterized membrane protein YbaN (DUF454 family)